VVKKSTQEGEGGEGGEGGARSGQRLSSPSSFDGELDDFDSRLLRSTAPAISVNIII